jgi:tetratricopeptide (TPR) repeat protein
VLAEQGDRRGAIEIYHHLIATYGPVEDRHLARIHSSLGKVLEADGDRQAALAAYQEALRINPKDGAARAALKRLPR